MIYTAEAFADVCCRLVPPGLTPDPGQGPVPDLRTEGEEGGLQPCLCAQAYSVRLDMNHFKDTSC